ncbi:protein of unknown function [Candidatus Nitrosocosmicus franklandus]|uniref:Uncharacterized protein n=1 Tax=Candidatus Nitrosocosmicus franklandianus TaxID=1798806 RepID=A0A484IGD2_9ARCH|nr:protein of unknown function [Candidatus Nitrosocosmicus franklandus]
MHHDILNRHKMYIYCMTNLEYPNHIMMSLHSLYKAIAAKKNEK